MLIIIDLPLCVVNRSDTRQHVRGRSKPPEALFL